VPHGSGRRAIGLGRQPPLEAKCGQRREQTNDHEREQQSIVKTGAQRQPGQRGPSMKPVVDASADAPL